MIIKALENKFDKKNKNRKTGADAKNDESTGHVDQ